MPYTTIFTAVKLIFIELSRSLILLFTILYFSLLVGAIKGSSTIIKGLAICLIG